MIRGEGPGRRVLRTRGHAAGGNGAAAVRKRRYRQRVLAKVREPPERLIAIARKSVVDAHVALILIDHLVARPRVVVRRGGVGWERVSVEQRQSDRIHGASWNRVAGKLLPRIPNRCRRIVDILAEYTRTLGERGHVGRHRAADALALTLIVGKKERSILHDRPAEHAAVLMPAVVRLHRVARLEVVGGVEVFITEELEEVAANRIAARLRREIDHPTIEPSEFGGRAVALDLELLDRVDHRVVGHLSRLRLQHRNAVEEIFIGSRSASVDARQDGIGRQRDARNDGGEHDEEAAVQRQLHHLLVLNDGPEACGLASRDRRIGNDRHLLANITDAEVEVDSRLFAGLEANAGAPDGLESGELDVETVFAGRQACGGVDAIDGRNGDPPSIRSRVGDGDGGPWHGRAGLVSDDAGDCRGRGLSDRRGARDHPGAGRGKAQPERSRASHRSAPTTLDRIDMVTQIGSMPLKSSHLSDCWLRMPAVRSRRT